MTELILLLVLAYLGFLKLSEHAVELYAAYQNIQLQMRQLDQDNGDEEEPDVDTVAFGFHHTTHDEDDEEDDDEDLRRK